MSEWLSFGAYGAFVWPCFLLAGLVLVWNVMAAHRLHSKARADARRRLAIDRSVP